MKASTKEKIIMITVPVLIFLICAAVTVFTDIYNSSHYVKPEPSAYEDYDYLKDVFPLQLDYLNHYKCYKFAVENKEDYLLQHGDMSEAELVKDEEYLELCDQISEQELLFLQAEKEAYEKFGSESFGENTLKQFGIKTLEEEKAEEARNNVLKWAIPFGALAVSAAVTVLIYRRRRKNEKLYWEKQEEKKKAKAAESVIE